MNARQRRTARRKGLNITFRADPRTNSAEVIEESVNKSTKKESFFSRLKTQIKGKIQ
jgi:hypothetical protein